MKKSQPAAFGLSVRIWTAIGIIYSVATLFAGCGGQGNANGGNRSQVPVATGITVSSITPVTGPTTGGTQITVTGTNFPSNVTVTFGGTPATSVVINSTTSATVTTPLHASGVVDVVVTDVATNTAATLNGAFTYFTPGTAIQITSTSPLPDVVVNTPYTQTIAAVGGNGAAKTFSLSQGTLPGGMSLSTTGVISGTPTTPGASIFTITVSDPSGSDSKQFTLTVADILRVTSPAALTDAIQNGTYNQQLTTSGGSGGQTWAVTAGAIPAGLALGASSGLISGLPTATGASSFTVTVVDALQTATMAFTLNVNPPLHITGATQNKAFSFTPPVVGGAGVTWSVSNGVLPSGLTINPPDGTISGTPTVSGTFNLTLTAVSAGSSTSTSGYLIVSAASPLVGNQGNPYATEGGVADPAAIPITACGVTLQRNTSYRVTQNISAGAANTCLNLPGPNLKLDLGGFTVTGRLAMNDNASGTIIFNGTVNCDWIDVGSLAGCVQILSGSPPLAQTRIHHLTIHNSGGSVGTTGSRAIHVDWAVPSAINAISMRFYNITSTVNNQPTVTRSHNLNITGDGQIVEIAYNDMTCGGDAEACQGAVCLFEADCKMHGNTMTMAVNTTGEGARSMVFDHGFNGEVWNNIVNTNNNRAVRVRDATNVFIHDNTFKSISGVSAAVHLADPDFGTDDLNAVVSNNSFEIADGIGIFIRSGKDAFVRHNTITCIAPCTGIFGDLRTPLNVACPAGVTKPGLLCGVPDTSSMVFETNSTVSVLPAPQILVAPGAVASVCNSGSTGPGPGGLGTVVPVATCP